MRLPTVLLPLGLLFAGCQGSSGLNGDSLCGPGGTLRVGYVGAVEGEARDAAQLIRSSDLERMRTLLTVASRCQVEFEPLLSPERARQRLQEDGWDLAFLPPGLTALAMQRSGGGQPVRRLMQRNRSRSALLVSSESQFRTVKDLKGQRLGLLPRGSLTGFYLPLYNLHGLQLKQVRYAISYDGLLELLRSGSVDVIAWDAGLPSPGGDVRVLAEDSHAIPSGSMVFSQALVLADHTSLLASLDASAAEMPEDLGYVAEFPPVPQAYQDLRQIVRHVESWSMPQDGFAYTVYGSTAEVQ